jgi:TonB family protein
LLSLPLLLLLAAEPAEPPTAAGNQLSAPVYAGAGYTKPAELKKHCVANAVRIPRWMTGIEGVVTSKFSVDAEGEVGDFEVLTDAPREVRLAVEQAVKSCQFTPGRTPEGKAIAIWLILPIRFKADPPPANQNSTGQVP